MKQIFTSTLLVILSCLGLTAQDMIITGTFDGPLTGGTPKVVEIYVINNIADISSYGFGSANNGGGTDGEELTFPVQSANAGDFLYVTDGQASFNTYFGFNADFVDNSAAINGDDAVELFHNGAVVDVFGDINMDGSGTPWDYLDGWAYRNDMGTIGITFTLGDWMFSGINVNDNQTSNATATTPFPIGTYQHSSGATTVVHNISVGGGANAFSPSSLTIDQGDSVVWTNAGGFHNVDGTLATYPSNPAGFTNGSASSASWVYGVKFDIPGTYTYQCNPHAGGGMIGTIIVTPAAVMNPEVAFTAAGTSVNENAGTVSINLSIANSNMTATTVDVSVGMSSTATGGMDYTFTSPTTITFPAGSSANQVLNIPIIDDVMTEGLETIVLELSNVTNSGTIGTNGTFTLGINANDAITPNIVINEIYYNVPSTDTLEFIELYNNELTAVDLTGWSFTQGVTHTFGSVMMQPGDYLVLTNNAASFQTAFGVTAIEWTSGSLSNGGEDIEIVDAANAVVDYVNYDDTAPWTEMADGAGNSLALCDVDSDNSLASNWLPEIADAGFVISFSTIFASPGVVNTITCPINPYADIEWITTEDSTGVADSIGTMAQTQGFVYGVNLRPAGLDFTVIDRRGNGVSVFSFNPVSNYTVTEGDYVVISGTIGQYNGLTQLSPDSILLVSGGHPLRLANLVDSLGEYTESSLIEIANVSLVTPSQWAGDGSSFNVDITDGTNTFSMRIDNDVDLSGMAAPTGTFNVTGIGRQFDASNPYTEGYQIFPRYMQDITPYNTTPTAPATYPAYSIGTVSTVDVDGVADSLAVTCELTGVVHGIDMQGNTNLGFTFIDATGGIGVFSSNDYGYTVVEGDEITVRGTISQFNGLTQVNPDTIIMNSSSNTLNTALVVTALDETTESELVSIEPVTLVDITSWDISGGSFNAEFTDGTNTFAVRIDSDVNIAGTTPFDLANSVVRITGIGGQFDNSSPYTEGYQLFPRYATDIEILNNTENNSLSEFINFFPNPVRETLTVESSINIETIVITNTLGQTMKTINGVNGTQTIDLSGLSRGLYIVTFQTENNSWTQQIIKQ